VSPTRRRDQTRELTAALEAYDATSVIVGGDFNTFLGRSGAAVDEAMAARSLVDATADVPWTYRARVGRLGLPWCTYRPDRIYVSGLTPIDARRVPQEPRASDHEPVIVALGEG